MNNEFRQWRQEHGMPRRALAKLLRVSHGQVSSYQNGQETPYLVMFALRIYSCAMSRDRPGLMRVIEEFLKPAVVDDRVKAKAEAAQDEELRKLGKV